MLRRHSSTAMCGLQWGCTPRGPYGQGVRVRRPVLMRCMAHLSPRAKPAHQLVPLVTTLTPHPHARAIIRRHASHRGVMTGGRRRGRVVWGPSRRRVWECGTGARWSAGPGTAVVEVLCMGWRRVRQGRARRGRAPLPSHTTETKHDSQSGPPDSMHIHIPVKYLNHIIYATCHHAQVCITSSTDSLQTH